MTRQIDVYCLPKLAQPEELEGTTAVVIDVLRATTTIIFALEAGADAVVPCEEIDEARRQAARFGPGEVVLGGERGGRPIEGFDLGNSPADFTPFAVKGRTVVFTTTNGTRALARASAAARVLAAGFVNAQAVCRRLIDAGHVSVICAGTDGEIGHDDVLLAGLLVDRLQRQSGLSVKLNAQALTARELWLSRFPLPQAIGAEPLDVNRLVTELRKSLGGRNLVSIGLDEDIVAAAQLDQFDVVPELNLATREIRLA